MQPIQPPPGRRPAPWPLWRRSLPVLALVALLLVALVLIALHPDVPTVGKVVAAVLGVFVVLLLAALLNALLTGGNRQPQVRIDSQGVALWSRQGRAEVPWSDVVALGVSWRRAPRTPGAVRQGHALDVFVADTAAYPEAGSLVVEEPAPAPNLPGTRLRLVVAEGDPTERLRAEAAPYAGGRWLETFQRAWLPGSTP